MKDNIIKHWKKYLPLLYSRKIPVDKGKNLKPDAVKSHKHQTESYRVQLFYKPISRYK